MVTAIVLVTCEVDQTPETAQALADLDGVSEVYSVAGDVTDCVVWPGGYVAETERLTHAVRAGRDLTVRA